MRPQYGIDVSPEFTKSLIDGGTGEGLAQHKAIYLGARHQRQTNNRCLT
ncbi:hypothetical protein [Achromobacter animicus]